eukprot:10948077-Alexandrium_andersonii.AAC.1
MAFLAAGPAGLAWEGAMGGGGIRPLPPHGPIPLGSVGSHVARLRARRARLTCPAEEQPADA